RILPVERSPPRHAPDTTPAPRGTGVVRGSRRVRVRSKRTAVRGGCRWCGRSGGLAFPPARLAGAPWIGIGGGSGVRGLCAVPPPWSGDPGGSRRVVVGGAPPVVLIGEDIAANSCPARGFSAAASPPVRSTRLNSSHVKISYAV